MWKHIILICIVYAIPVYAQKACTATDIINGSIDNCTCVEGTSSCHTCPVVQYGLSVCDTVCNSGNKQCSACDIYYGKSGICGCLQEKNCVFGKTWNGKGKPPIWILRQFSANLVSSTVLNTGVEQLDKMPDKNYGWILGLQKMQKKTEALAMNSKHSRSRNQIHIHICSKNTNADKVLSYLDKSQYSSFAKVPNTGWYCKYANNGNSVSSDSIDYIKSSSIDINRAGIGVLTDSNGRLWNCISTSGAAEYIFCN